MCLISIFHLQVLDDGSVNVIWHNDHLSNYSAQWLQKYNFSQENQQNRLLTLREPPVPWNNKMMQNDIPKVKFDDVSILF